MCRCAICSCQRRHASRRAASDRAGGPSPIPGRCMRPCRFGLDMGPDPAIRSLGPGSAAVPPLTLVSASWLAAPPAAESPDDCALSGDAGRRSPAGGSAAGERDVLSLPCASSGGAADSANAASRARRIGVLRMMPPEGLRWIDSARCGFLRTGNGCALDVRAGPHRQQRPCGLDCSCAAALNSTCVCAPVDVSPPSAAYTCWAPPSGVSQ